MSSEPTIYRYEYRPRGTLDAKRDFTVARSKAEAERIVKGKLTADYGAGNYDLSEIVEASFDDLPDDESAFQRISAEIDRRKPKPTPRGPFWALRVGPDFRQRMTVYAKTKAEAVEKATSQLLADGGRFHSGPPAIHPAVQSLSVDEMRARVSGRSSVFSALPPDDARQFVSDLLQEHFASLLNHHRESIDRLEKEAKGGELALPSTVKPPKPSGLLLEGLEHCKQNASIDEESLPEAVHAEVV